MLNKLKRLLFAGGEYVNTKTFSDEYITWLTFANAGMLHKGNPYCMDYAIKNLPTSNPVLEIGSFCGLSTNVITYLLARHDKNNQVFSADKWIFEGAKKGKNIGFSNVTHDEYREYVKSSFMSNVRFFSSGNLPYTIEKFSDEFFEQWGKGETVKDVFDRDIDLGGNISFCYIDGNHTYDFAKRDFDNVNQYLDIGGYILFDDSSDIDRFGLTKLMKEINLNNDYRLVMKNPNYLFMKIA